MGPNILESEQFLKKNTRCMFLCQRSIVLQQCGENVPSFLGRVPLTDALGSPGRSVVDSRIS